MERGYSDIPSFCSPNHRFRFRSDGGKLLSVQVGEETGQVCRRGAERTFRQLPSNFDDKGWIEFLTIPERRLQHVIGEAVLRVCGSPVAKGYNSGAAKPCERMPPAYKVPIHI